MQEFSPIARVGQVSADLNQRQGRDRRDPKGRPSAKGESVKSAPGDVEDDYQPSSSSEATTALVEALDRLRATGELNPAEETTRRLLRGQRYYQGPPKEAPEHP